MKLTITIIALLFFVGITGFLYGERTQLKKVITLENKVNHYENNWNPNKDKEKSRALKEGRK